MRKISSILILVVIIFIYVFTTAIHAESNLTIKLKENLIPLKTVEAGNGFEDLMPLKEILKDKKVIGMGEATHGTKEFFQMKHRMFEFLVEEMGYRVFAIEASFDDCQVVNDYILNGIGSMDIAIRAMKFWTWATEEVADMIEWMKNYNKNPENKDKIKFYGFDMQFISRNVSHVSEYIERVDRKDKEKQMLAWSKLIRLDANPDEEELIKLKDIINNMLVHFNNNKEDYINKSSAKEFDLMLQYITVIDQWIVYNNSDDDSSFSYRDRSMANNVKWILDYETKYNGNDKIMLWAHNDHVSKKYKDLVNMGQNLKEILEDDYYSIGFDSFEGSFRSIPQTIGGESYKLANFTLPNRPKKSIVYELEKTDIPLSYLDFNSSKEDKDILELLSSENFFPTIGSSYMGDYFKSLYLDQQIPMEKYDALIFIKESSAAVGYKSPSEIIDGDQLILDYYKSYFIIGQVLIVILFIGIIIYLSRKNKNKNKVSLIDKETIDSKVDSLISTKDEEEAKGIKRKLIELHKYASSLSTIKYIFLTIILLLVVSGIEHILYNILLLEIAVIEEKSWLLGDYFIEYTISMIGSSIIGVVIYNVLPYKIFRYFSKEKLIKISHIVLWSIILGGIRYFSFKSLMFAITGIISSFIMNYSYVLYLYKDKKPFLIVSLITILDVIGFNLLSLIIYNIFN